MNIKTWLNLTTNDIFTIYDKCVLGSGKTRRIFIDRKSDVLFVAHADTVLRSMFIKENKNRVYGVGMDDRLGCYTADKLSRELSADLLITDLEESGATTAQYHECKDYNWIVEFDRAGSDFVTYGMDCDDFLKALEVFWENGIGSYSDICDLDSEACCFNLGIGYEYAHSKDSYYCKQTYKEQIAKFRRFYSIHKNTQFKRDINSYNTWDRWGYGYGACEICGNFYADDLYGRMICEDCFERMYENYVFFHTE